MNVSRGDVVLARFPHAAGGRGKKRPVIIVQADVYNQSLRHVIVAEVTTNLGAATDPANLLVEVATPDGQATGQGHRQVVGWFAVEDRQLPEGGVGAAVKAAR